MTTQRLLRLPAVIDATGLARSTIYARMKAGTFPEKVKMGRATGWLAAEIENFINDCVAASRRSTDVA